MDQPKGIYLPGDKTPREWKACAGCGKQVLIGRRRRYCSRACYFATELAGETARQQMRAQWERQRAETGQQIGYSGCHRRVRKARGRAGDQACEQCGKPAKDWAYTHGADPANPLNYRPLCRICHFAYDQVRARQIETLGPEGRTAAAKNRWSKRTPEQRSELLRKAWVTRRANAEARATSDLELADHRPRDQE